MRRKKMDMKENEHCCELMDEKDCYWEELDGWVYRGRGVWLHSSSSHKVRIPWWNLRQRLFYGRENIAGYSLCTGLRCRYCGEEVPEYVQGQIADFTKGWF